jgi:hypothetical protein
MERCDIGRDESRRPHHSRNGALRAGQCPTANAYH